MKCTVTLSRTMFTVYMLVKRGRSLDKKHKEGAKNVGLSRPCRTGYISFLMTLVHSGMYIQHPTIHIFCLPYERRVMKIFSKFYVFGSPKHPACTDLHSSLVPFVWMLIVVSFFDYFVRMENHSHKNFYKHWRIKFGNYLNYLFLFFSFLHLF